MSEHSFEYDLPHGPPDLGADAPVMFHYNFIPGLPAKLDGAPEDCYPAIADHLELIGVDVVGEKRPYVPLTGAWSLHMDAQMAFYDGDETLWAALIEHAKSELEARDEAREEDYGEWRREQRRELYE